jgi:hypothetical protein
LNVKIAAINGGIIGPNARCGLFDDSSLMISRNDLWSRSTVTGKSRWGAAVPEKPSLLYHAEPEFFENLRPRGRPARGAFSAD